MSILMQIKNVLRLSNCASVGEKILIITSYVNKSSIYKQRYVFKRNRDFFGIHRIALLLVNRIYKISCGLMFGKVKCSDYGIKFRKRNANVCSYSQQYSLLHEFWNFVL